MVGSWIINLFFAFFGFTIVFISSFANNGIITSLIRACIGFIFFFILAYFFRWLIHFILKSPATESDTEEENQPVNSDPENQNNTKTPVSPEGLTEEEAKLASQYISELLNQKD